MQANERVTFVTEGVEHILSTYDSIKGTKKLLLFTSSRKNGAYFRIHLCVSCTFCEKLEFLKCTNAYCGAWKFHYFDINQKHLKELFFMVFGQPKSTEAIASFDSIMKIIGRFYGAL